MAQVEAMLAEPLKALQLAFIERCKSQMATPAEVMYATYVLFGEEGDTQLLRAMLARKTPAEAIRIHNYHVVGVRETGFLDQYGHLLERMKWPLFPPAAEFSTLNAKLLQELSGPEGGASVSTRGPNTS